MSEEKNEGKSTFYKKQKLGEKGLKAQAAVTSAAGSMTTFENEDRETGKKNSKRSSQRNRKRRKNKRSGRPQNRQEKGRQNRSKVETEQKKPVNSNNSMEERLDYYRKKYGEDFQSSGKKKKP